MWINHGQIFFIHVDLFHSSGQCLTYKNVYNAILFSLIVIGLGIGGKQAVHSTNAYRADAAFATSSLFATVDVV
jgi:hypothetical protein